MGLIGFGTCEFGSLFELSNSLIFNQLYRSLFIGSHAVPCSLSCIVGLYLPEIAKIRPQTVVVTVF